MTRLASTLAPALMATLLLSACGTSAPPETAPEANALVNAASDTNDYFEVRLKAQIVVLGSPASRDAVEAGTKLPRSVTHEGRGPHGRDVIVEADKKDPELERRLWARFEAQHLYYEEVHAHGRIYVLGSKASSKTFAATQHLPYAHIQIGQGPDRETLIFEAPAGNPTYLKRLQRTYAERHPSDR